MKKLFFSLLCPLLLVAQHSHATERIVSLGGSVTEIIYALGKEQKLIGVDSSSIYPEAARKLPQVGYYRSIPVEGVVALKPSLILSSEVAGPKKTLDDLKNLGIPIESIPDKPSIETLYQRIETIANILSIPEKGQQLTQQIKEDIQSASAMPSQALDTILIINRTGSLMAAGNATSAHEIMRLAGVRNLFEHQKGFKPVSAESLINAKPELIIVTDFSVKASGDLNKLKSLPALVDSPAVKNNRILVLDDLLAMGLGPRTGEAIRQIKAATLKNQ